MVVGPSMDWCWNPKSIRCCTRSVRVNVVFVVDYYAVADQAKLDRSCPPMLFDERWLPVRALPAPVSSCSTTECSVIQLLVEVDDHDESHVDSVVVSDREKEQLVQDAKPRRICRGSCLELVGHHRVVAGEAHR